MTLLDNPPTPTLDGRYVVYREHWSPDGVTSVAVYSLDGCYRYSLSRVWENGTGLVQFVCLNPSTATEDKNDPTVARLCRWARDWGYGGVVVTNLFAFRATAPARMKAQADPVGPENDYFILHHATGRDVDLVVLAWGNHGAHRDRNSRVLKLLDPTDGLGKGIKGKLRHFGLTKAGEPKHPLYQPHDTSLVTW